MISALRFGAGFFYLPTFCVTASVTCDTAFHTSVMPALWCTPFGNCLTTSPRITSHAPSTMAHAASSNHVPGTTDCTQTFVFAFHSSMGKFFATVERMNLTTNGMSACHIVNSKKKRPVRISIRAQVCFDLRQSSNKTYIISVQTNNVA